MARDIDPSNPNYLSAYAYFLEGAKKDYDLAEELYLDSIKSGIELRDIGLFLYFI